MKGIRKLLVLSLAIFATATARADDLAACIYSNGVLQGKVLLSSKPVLKSQGDDITMLLDGGVVLEVPALGTVIKFEDAEGEPSAVSQVSSDNVPLYRITGGSVSLSGLAPGSTVQIHTLDGRLVSAARADGDGHASLPTSKGVMIVSAGSISMKLINK